LIYAKVYKLLNILLSMVRNKTEWRTITVSGNIYNRIEEDRKDFEKTIKGGKWSMNDALVERQKILDIFKKAGGFQALK